MHLKSYWGINIWVVSVSLFFLFFFFCSFPFLVLKQLQKFYVEILLIKGIWKWNYDPGEDPAVLPNSICFISVLNYFFFNQLNNPVNLVLAWPTLFNFAPSWWHCILEQDTHPVSPRLRNKEKFKMNDPLFPQFLMWRHSSALQWDNSLNCNDSIALLQHMDVLRWKQTINPPSAVVIDPAASCMLLKLR